MRSSNDSINQVFDIVGPNPSSTQIINGLKNNGWYLISKPEYTEIESQYKHDCNEIELTGHFDILTMCSRYRLSTLDQRYIKNVKHHVALNYLGNIGKELGIIDRDNPPTQFLLGESM